MIDEETIRLKFRNKIYLPLTRNFRRKKLKDENFTIISNNCWGGTVYESYGIRKLSPTVGMFIMPEDYLKFVGNLDLYFNQGIKFIPPEKSKWENVLKNKDNWGKYLIAELGDIELHMLHYHDEKIAEQKWKNRVKRVNYERMLVKFNDQNGCTIKNIEDFCKLPLKNKICFVSNKDYVINNITVYVRQPSRCGTNGIMASREPYGNTRILNLHRIINNL